MKGPQYTADIDEILHFASQSRSLRAVLQVRDRPLETTVMNKIWSAGRISLYDIFVHDQIIITHDLNSRRVRVEWYTHTMWYDVDELTRSEKRSEGQRVDSYQLEIKIWEESLFQLFENIRMSSYGKEEGSEGC
jgi:hypothetical protein